MKVLKSTPDGRPRRASADSPVPSTNRKSTGWMSPVIARSRSLRNLMSSRRQTITAARTSWRMLRSGTRTRMVSLSSPASVPTGDVVTGVAMLITSSFARR
jgi:hypothetical protein